MSDPKDQDQANADALSQTGEQTGIELDEKQLDSVSGGVINTIKGNKKI